jgi:IS30 family transposase
MSKNKHLTLDDRIEIQECLAKGMTFKAILRRI